MKISEKGIEFIIKEEGEILEAYICPAGVLTIGVGHTGKDVKSGMKITKEKSREFLKNDLIKFENSVNRSVKVSLTQNQFDALVSFVFNVGTGAFETSTLLKKINASASIGEIEEQFRRWNRGGGKILPILVGRREREIKLYKGEY
ncbi:lysozyme [Fusobacterium varium]